MPDGTASTGGIECSHSLIGICHIAGTQMFLWDKQNMELDLGFHVWADSISPGPLLNISCCGYVATIMLFSLPFVSYLFCSYLMNGLKSQIVLGKNYVTFSVGKLTYCPSISYPVFKYFSMEKTSKAL